MLEENKSFTSGEKGYALLKEALEVSEYLVNNPNVDFAKINEINPALASFDIRQLLPLLSTFKQPVNKNNVLTSGAIFYIISEGKYPQDIWKDASQSIKETQLEKIKDAFIAFNSVLGNNSSQRYNDELIRLTKQLKREQIMPHIDESMRIPGLVNIFELMYETFINKYDKYSPRIYSLQLKRFINKSFHHRLDLKECELKEDKYNVYATAYAGNIDKPGHADCEDYVLVRKFDKSGKTFLVVVCDGVGSAIDSETGSRCASEALYDVISRKLKIIATRNGDTIRRYSPMMAFFELDLAKELYQRWEELVKNSPSYQKVKKQRPGMEQFTTTMQFAFVTPLFIATGKIGDGSFYVRKVEENGNNDLEGMFSLTDGRSDVLEKSVLTLASLKSLPNALQIDFYRRHEIKDMLITSDGVSPLFEDDLLLAHHLMRDLYNLPYEERVKELERIAKRGSDSNTVDYGTGDDASVAYIAFKKED